MNPMEQQSDWTRGMSGSRRLANSSTVIDPMGSEGPSSEPTQGEMGSVTPVAAKPIRTQMARHAGNWRGTRLGLSKPSWIWSDGAHWPSLAKSGPLDWIQSIRGLLFFGLLTMVLWLEWLAIKALALYVTAFI